MLTTIYSGSQGKENPVETDMKRRQTEILQPQAVLVTVPNPTGSQFRDIKNPRNTNLQYI